MGIIGKVMGPWTLSYHLAGVQDFLLWTLTDPDKVLGLLDRLKEVSIAFARAQLQAGADAVVIADHATGDLVSPKTYRDFPFPVHREINHRIGGPTILHLCGNCSDRSVSLWKPGSMPIISNGRWTQRWRLRWLTRKFAGGKSRTGKSFSGEHLKTFISRPDKYRGRRRYPCPGVCRSAPDPHCQPESNR